jgi:hypothetical protein
LLTAGATFLGAGAILAGCLVYLPKNGSHSGSGAGNAARAGASEQAMTNNFLSLAGDSLLNMHEQAGDGWRFKSAIQAPHYQTDRDVGAASVGMGFLVMADQDPKDGKWLQAAEKTADWLTAVAQTDGKGGTYWTDYVDGNQKSADVYTSFDDGAIGIGDFYWQLYAKTHDQQYKNIALSSLQWTFAQAQNIGTTAVPAYSWPWEPADAGSPHYMGMGEGAAGLVYSFAGYYQRLKDSDPALAAQCRQYIDGTLRYMSQARTALGNNNGDARALPETGIIGRDGDTTMNSGYLSGAAGAAFMYLKLYQVFHDQQYLTDANSIFSWLQDTRSGPMVTLPDGSVAWKLSLDPQGGDDPELATGFEEGAAGIGWTYLQAYKITGDQQYLSIAKKAANWLSDVSVKSVSGITWHEDESPTNPIIHTNLNNGAAGIGMFLSDLAGVTGDAKYQNMAQQALNWITAAAQHDGSNIYWNDNDGENNYSRDPSWHWGTAGIIAFTARMAGGSVDIPGEEPGL